MKNHSFQSLMACIFMFAPISGLFAQGSLTPPGAPGPTMKTLTEIEPRTAINTINTPGDALSVFKITQPGSYYLTGNVTGVSAKHGILVASNNVNIDLNGFALIGVSGSYVGISDGYIYHGNNTIKNGSLISWSAGIDLGASYDSIVEKLIVTNCSGIGMKLGDACVLSQCVSRDNGGDNIVSATNGNLSHCTAVGSATGHGFVLGQKSILANCAANFNKLNGINAASDCTISESTAAKNQNNGLNVGDGTTVSGCVARDNTAANITTGFNSNVSHCTILGSVSGVGIYLGQNGTMSDCVANFNGASGVLTGTGCSVVHVVASQNSGGGGIAAGEGCFVSYSATYKNTGYGFYALSPGTVISQCTADANTQTGFYLGNGVASRQCNSVYNLQGGFSLFDGSSVHDCKAYGNAGDGFTTTADCVIERCSAIANSAWGISVTQLCHVTDCYTYGQTNLAAGGIGLQTTNSVCSGNVCESNSRGIVAVGANNLIVRNTAIASIGNNYAAVAGNRVATIVVPAVAAAINGNTGGTAFSTDANANLAY